MRNSHTQTHTHTISPSDPGLYFITKKERKKEKGIFQLLLLPKSKFLIIGIKFLFKI